VLMGVNSRKASNIFFRMLRVTHLCRQFANRAE
jgi:hypothetical protein